jgi:hypothetical protein
MPGRVVCFQKLLCFRRRVPSFHNQNPKERIEMSIIGSRINDRLVRSFKAIDNTLKTPAILAGVTPYGYGPDHMQVGLALYQSAFEAFNANTVAGGAQARASERVTTTFKEAVDAYQALAKIARTIYRKNPERLVTLG